MNKRETLWMLASRGLNVHNYKIPNSCSELMSIVRDYDQCSIRFDSKEHSMELPFYLIEDYEPVELVKIWSEAEELDCRLIVSDGHQYEDNLLYNVAVEFGIDGDFRADVCKDKVPLRHMYRGKVVSIVGNILSDRTLERSLPKYITDKRKFVVDLFNVYTHCIYNKVIELSIYDKPVGVKDEFIAYWQVCDKQRDRGDRSGD